MNSIIIFLLGAVLLFLLPDAATAAEVHQLVMQGRVDQLRKALKLKPSAVNARDKEGRTPLHLAAAGGNAKVATVLLEKGADVNSRAPDDFTPLHYAAAGGHVAVAELLLAAGADPHLKDKSGLTPVERTPETSKAMRDLLQKGVPKQQKK